jgi:hypothetical protein
MLGWWLSLRRKTLCVCGHPREVHEHWRADTDCGTCGAYVCGKFQRRR